jgi:hypothetical protein
MNKLAIVSLAVVTAFVLATGASADQFTYGYDGSGFDATITYTANSVAGDPGVYQITSVAGIIDSAGSDITAPVSFNTSVYADPNGTGPNTAYFPNNGFSYDNLLTPSATPTLDTYGVLFDVDGLYFNLYSEDGVYQWADNGVYTNLSNLADPMDDPPDTTPEPGSLMLFGTGFLVLAGLVYRRKVRVLVKL